MILVIFFPVTRPTVPFCSDLEFFLPLAAKKGKLVSESEIYVFYNVIYYTDLLDLNTHWCCNYNKRLVWKTFCLWDGFGGKKTEL